MSPDRTVFFVTLGAAALVASYSFGIDEGVARHAKTIATECKRTQDERELLSSVQRSDGITCTYSLNGYGRAKRTRRAM